MARRTRKCSIALLGVLLILGACTVGGAPGDEAVSGAAPVGTSAAGSGAPGAPGHNSADEGDTPAAVPALPPPVPPAGADPGADAPDGPGDEASDALAAMPGLYGLSLLRTAVFDDRIEFDAATDCSSTLQVLQAGQWAVEPVAEPDLPDGAGAGANGPVMGLAALWLAGQSSMARLNEGVDSCSGSITLPGTAQFTLGGEEGQIAGGTDPARYLPLLCEADADASRVRLGGLYATDDGTFLVSATIPMETGTSDLPAAATADIPALGAFTALRAPEGGAPVTWAIRHLAAALLEGGEIGVAPAGPFVLHGEPDAPAQVWTPLPSAHVSATIIGLAPLAGSITATSLTSTSVTAQQASAPASLTAGFGCQIS